MSRYKNLTTPAVSYKELAFTAWFFTLLILTGCVTTTTSGNNPSGIPTSAPAPTGDLITASDESPARRQARVRFELATGYFSEGKTTIALDELKLALIADPNFGDGYNLRGLIYNRLGENTLAEDSFKRALQINPRDGDALHNYGFMLCQQKRFDEAYTHFTRALGLPLYAGQSRTFMARGICELNQGRKPEAERSFSRSYELDAGNPISGYNLTQLLYERGDFSRAQFYAKRLNNSELANEQTLWLGIKIERRMGQNETMQQLATQLRRRYPASKELASYERGAFDE